MDENEIREHRFRFFTEKGLDIALEQSKAFSALFTAVIAGLLALVVYDKVSFWSATLFLIADAMAVMGLAWNLLHMSYTSKLMLAYAAYFAGEEDVPNVIEPFRKTVDEIPWNRAWAQRAYGHQLAYLFITVTLAGAGLAVELWEHVRWGGLVLAILFAVLILAAVTFGRVLRRAMLNRRSAKQSK